MELPTPTNVREVRRFLEPVEQILTKTGRPDTAHTRITLQRQSVGVGRPTK